MYGARMKRIPIALFLGLLINTFAFAQLGAFSQYGKVTQDVTGGAAGGLFASHSNIPLGSKVKVINTATEKSIEVTITGRIPISPRRILDLSPAAWEELGLTPDTFIRLIYEPIKLAPAPPPPPPKKEEPPEEIVEDPPPEEKEPVKAAPKTTADYEADVLEWLADVMVPMYEVTVVPCLPDPNSDQIYHLQVGAYSKQENADRAELLVRAAGFNAVQETHKGNQRVIAVEIPARHVYSAAQRLGVLGFQEIWVRK